MLGITFVPIVPVLLNFAGEITFPQEPTVITGFMMMLGRISGFFLSLLVAYVCENYDIYGFIILDSLTFIGGVLTLFLKEDLKRSNYKEIKEEDEAAKERIGQRFSLAEAIRESWR